MVRKYDGSLGGLALVLSSVCTPTLYNMTKHRLCVGLIVLTAKFTFGQAGTLDPTFGSNGTVVTNVGGTNDYGRGVVVQPDGKVIVVGHTSLDQDINPGRLAVARYNADGSPDASFGSGGIALVSLDDYLIMTYDVALQSDGRIVIAGTDFVLVRLTTTGELDPTFGANGIAMYDNLYPALDHADRVVVQSDDKIVVAGSDLYGGQPTCELIRFNGNGALDQTFGISGVVFTNIGGFWSEFRDVVLMPDGRIVAAGIRNNVSDSSDFVVARYYPSGQLDFTFGQAGFVCTDFNLGLDQAKTLAVRSDGRIVVCGTSFHDLQYEFDIAQYMPNGSLDPSFGNGGMLTLDDGNPFSSVLQPDDKLLVSGHIGNVSGVFRFLSNGVLDTTFGTDGHASSLAIWDIALQADGKILVADRTQPQGNGIFDFIVQRFRNDIVNIGIRETVGAGHDAIVYPCPADNEVTLILPDCVSGVSSIQLLDVDGRLVRSYGAGSWLDRRVHLDLTGLASGSYVLELRDASQNAVARMLKR